MLCGRNYRKRINSYYGCFYWYLITSMISLPLIKTFKLTHVNIATRQINQWWNGIWNESYMNCGYEIKWSYDLRSYKRNFCNWIDKPEKFRTSTGFEPLTSRFRCDALTNWAMKPLTLGTGYFWVLMVPWGMNQWWNGIWNESYMNCGYEIKWSYDLRSYERNFCNCVEMTSSQRQWLHSSVG